MLLMRYAAYVLAYAAAALVVDAVLLFRNAMFLLKRTVPEPVSQTASQQTSN